MKISRYIKFPLIFILLYGVYFGLFTAKPSLSLMLFGIIFGAVFGFGFQFYSDYKVRQIKPDADEKDFDVCQKQTFVLFYDYDKAFDLCLESMEYVEKAKLKYTDKLTGTIKAKTGISWTSWGNNIDFKILKLTDYTTEIEVLTRPSLKTALIDNGKGVAVIETVKDFFSRKNDEKNQMLSAKQQQTAADETFSREKDFVKARA
jgi:hypothetical protein